MLNDPLEDPYSPRSNTRGRNHNKALYVSIECRGTTLAHVLVDIGSSLNVLPSYMPFHSKFGLDP